MDGMVNLTRQSGVTVLSQLLETTYLEAVLISINHSFIKTRIMGFRGIHPPVVASKPSLKYIHNKNQFFNSIKLKSL